MGLNYENLDGTTRGLMVEEIDADEGRLYTSNYLNETGQTRWPALLREAAATGTDDSLAAALKAENCFKEQVERRTPKGSTTLVKVPVTAAQTLAESQFNMYYMRALARRAIDDGKALTVYRAKEVNKPRPESEQLIGTQLVATKVLTALRETRGVDPSIGIPMPNTGITVKLI